MNRLIAEILIVIVVLFSALEIARWRRPELADVLTDMQKGRRVIGMLLLLVLGGMAYFGTYWPPPILVPRVVRDMEMIYWLFFALLTLFLPLIAFLEFKDSIKRASQMRREVYRDIITAPLDELPSEDDDSEQKPG